MKLKTLILASILALGATASAQAQVAPGDYCGLLWFQRNSLFKQAGYCFKTAKAIRQFGNAGCQYDDINDVPLSARDRKTIDTLQNLERQHNCPR
jgi:hypothetical protein